MYSGKGVAWMEQTPSLCTTPVRLEPPLSGGVHAPKHGV